MLPQGSGTAAQWINTLSRVTLVSFSALPSSIGPFGQSTLRWHVSGPAAGFRVTLNGTQVPRSGEETVLPFVTVTYVLNVNAGPYYRNLGSVDVKVNTAGCGIISQPTQAIGTQLSTFVHNAVLDADNTLYFRTHTVATGTGQTESITYAPEVMFRPGRIQIVLHLGKKVPDFPDPSIDLTIELGLAVSDGMLVAVDPTVSGDVSEPWYAYLAPGAFPILYIIVDDAQDKLTMDFQSLVQALPEFISLLYIADSGLRYQTVSIQGQPTTEPIQITACPSPPQITIDPSSPYY